MNLSRYVLQGDARLILPELEPSSIDCVIVDPPYGDTALAWDRRVSGWMADLRRILLPHGSVWVFGSMRYFIEQAAEFAGWRYAQDVVWEKHNGSNSFADRFRRVHEHAVQFYPDDVKWGDVYKSPQHSADAVAKQVRRKQKAQHWSKTKPGSYQSVDGGPRLMRSVLLVRSEHGTAVHPTQKPVELIEMLLAYSCKPGGVALDPFCGSGTTGVAAKRSGLGFIGIELEDQYAMIARNRIEDESPLFHVVDRECEVTA